MRNTDTKICPYCGNYFAKLPNSILIKPGYRVCCYCGKALMYKKDKFFQYAKELQRSKKEIEPIVFEASDTQITTTIKLARKVNELVTAYNALLCVEDINA